MLKKNTEFDTDFESIEKVAKNCTFDGGFEIIEFFWINFSVM
jgi:hypothetical protein